MNPQVSFVVPCYNLGHLLSQCVTSILSQTYDHLEVLIMDDCSPDHTPEVARSFRDPRVKHIRNAPNLGHLRNYNKGIGLARGKYVWLISADDFLRRTYVVERYVGLMEDHPQVGYVICPTISFEDGREARVMDFSVHAHNDTIFPGRKFLSKLLKSNCVPAPAGMVRKECYDRLGGFPLDMKVTGDWYLWSLFALYYDVGYLAEPMVCYRRHPQSMTDTLCRTDLRIWTDEDILHSWRIRQKTKEAGYPALVQECRQLIANQYAASLASKGFKSSSGWHECRISLEEFEASLRRNTNDPEEQRYIRARVYAGAADAYYWQRDFARAREFYGKALREDARMPKVRAKCLLLALGTSGIFFRDTLPSLRQAITGTKTSQ